jgi:carbon-monoxide dehydrogenase medium subunit
VTAREFFVDWYTTALQPGEMVSAVLLPPSRGGAGVYVKHARVAGDYATASAAACLEPDGRCRVAIGACGPAPLADPAIDAALSDVLGDAALSAAADRLSGMADPLDDVRGSADYRRRLIAPLLRRAVRAAEAALQRAPARAASRP